jgi:hypothetical protein
MLFLVPIFENERFREYSAVIVASKKYWQVAVSLSLKIHFEYNLIATILQTLETRLNHTSDKFNSGTLFHLYCAITIQSMTPRFMTKILPTWSA